jgi:Flp pilus assembly protein TadG
MSNRRGQSTLELALVLPLLLLLVLGIVDLGRVFVASNSLTHASRESARYGALNWNDVNSGSGIRQRLIAAAGNSGVTVTTGQIAVDYFDGAGLGQIGTWPVSPDAFQPAGSCPVGRVSCAAPIPGDSIRVTVAVPWSAQTAIIQNILPSNFQVKGATSSVIEQ